MAITEMNYAMPHTVDASEVTYHQSDVESALDELSAISNNKIHYTYTVTNLSVSTQWGQMYMSDVVRIYFSENIDVNNIKTVQYSYVSTDSNAGLIYCNGLRTNEAIFKVLRASSGTINGIIYLDIEMN